MDKRFSEKEAQAIAHGHGFSPYGEYTITDKTPTGTTTGSIIMTGKFTENKDFVEFKRSDFSDRGWSAVCTAFGYKYHNHKDIEKFVVRGGKNQKGYDYISIEVFVNILIPKGDTV